MIDLTSGTVTTGPSDSVLSLMTNASTTVSVANGSLTLGAATSSIGGPITVSSTGTLALSGTALIGTGTVTDSGHLTTSNSSTALSSITMASGSALNLGNFTVQPGATLSVSASASVTIGPATAANTYTTLTDNGTVSFATGDTVSLSTPQRQLRYYGAQIVVGSGGLLQATGTAFNATNGNGTNAAYTQITVNSGGHLQASSSTFAVGHVDLADGVVFNAGDLTGDGFNSPLYIPAIDVQYLSGRQQQPAVPEHLHPGGHDRQRRDAGAEPDRHPDHDQPPLRLPRRPHGQPGRERHRRRQRPGRALRRAHREPGGQRVVRRQRPGDDRAGDGRYTSRR